MKNASIASRKKSSVRLTTSDIMSDVLFDSHWLENEVDSIIRDISIHSFEPVEKYKLDTDKIKEELQKKKSSTG